MWALLDRIVGDGFETTERLPPTNNYKLKHEINLIGCETEAARVYIVEDVAIKALYGGTIDKSAVRDHDGELRIELLMDGSGGL